MRRVLTFAAAMVCAPSVALGVSITAHGGVPGQNTTSALNAAAAAARSSDGVVTFPVGVWPFDSPPEALNGVRLIGSGMHLTSLVRRYSGGTFLHWTGLGGGVEAMQLFAGLGTAGGYAVSVVATNASPVGYMTFRDMGIDGEEGVTTGLWAVPVYLNGTARTAAPIGVRSTSFNNVYVWNATSYAVYIGTGVAVTWLGGGTFRGGGTNGDVFIAGIPDASPAMLSSNINWDASVGGTLWICDAEGVNARGVLSGLWVGCSGGNHVIVGPVFGPIVNYLTTVRIIAQR